MERTNALEPDLVAITGDLVDGDVATLSDALSRMSTHIEQLLDQKTFLLRELLHRVMNSLTLLTSGRAKTHRSSRKPAEREVIRTIR